MDQTTEVVKKAYREVLLRRRTLVPSTELGRISHHICRHLHTWLLDQGVTTVFMYIPVRGEIDLRSLVATVPLLEYALPVTSSSEMNFYRWSAGDPLRTGPYGIPEPIPIGAALAPDSSTVILVPSLAVSHNGVRLGYGGGYFDRYLAKYHATVVAVTTDDFLLPELPVEPHDKLMDWVVTESGLLKLTASNRT